MTHEPFKCPDCSVWWRGDTHKCVTASKEVNPSRAGWISCPMCGKNVTKYDWHSCSHPNSITKKKRDPHEPPRWNT